MAGTSSSPSTASTTSEYESQGAANPRRVRQKFVLPPDWTLTTVTRDLRTATDPKHRDDLKQGKRVIMNRAAAKKSRNVKRERLEYLERHTVEQQTIINNMQARLAQMDALLRQAQQNAYLWQQRAQQAQYSLPSLATTMADLPVSSERVLLPSSPGWGHPQFGPMGTIDPQRVNSIPATLTQEYAVDLDAAIANFAE